MQTQDTKAAFDAMREALEAIVARIEGDFDHAALVKQGVLTLDSKADIKGFAKAALALAKGSTRTKGRMH